MLKIIKNIFALSLIFIGCSVVGVNLLDWRAILFLPVNVLVPNDIQLKVCVPKRFQLLGEPGARIHEFNAVENGSTIWSESFVTQIFVGQKKTASTIVDTIKRQFLVPNQGEIIEELSEQRDGYVRHKLIMAYNDPSMQGRRHVVFMQYFSSEFDCSGFHYFVALENFPSLEAAVQQLRKFVQENCHIQRKKE